MQVKINELQLSYTEGFHEMDENEKAGLNFYKEGPGVCLSDPEKHIIVSIGWVKSGLASVMISEKEAAKKAEEKISSPMKAYGYVLEGFSDYIVDGEKACGYRYHYTAQDIGMTGETIVVKYRKVFYYLNFYARTELLDESLKIWQEMLDSAKWEK